jgi:hypothetical protein
MVNSVKTRGVVMFSLEILKILCKFQGTIYFLLTALTLLTWEVFEAKNDLNRGENNLLTGVNRC